MIFHRITWGIAFCLTLCSQLGLAAKTTRVGVNDFGVENNDDSCCESPAMSADGRFVTFLSDSSNLVPNDTNDKLAIFLRDRDNDVVNGLVSLTPQVGSLQTGFKAQGCNGGFVGQFSFDARLNNTGDVDLAHTNMLVSRLTGGNKLTTSVRTLASA